MRYILHYTQPGDIIFDGFAGTGMTGVAAQLCGNPDPELKFTINSEFKDMGLPTPVWGTRRAICGDLSPIASFIAYNYNTPSDPIAFEEEANLVLKALEDECAWMYATTHKNGNEGRINYTVWSDVFACSSCGEEIVFWEAALDKEKGEIKKEFSCPHCHSNQTKKRMEKAFVTIYDQVLGTTIRQSKTVPVLINYTYAGKRFEKKPDSADIALIRKIEQVETPYWYPIDRMPEGDESRRNDRIGLTHVHHFYTKRNNMLYANAFSKSNRPIIKTWITSSQIRTTKMYKYVPVLANGRLADRRTGTVSGTLYIPSLFDENCPFNLLRSKIRNFMRIGGKERNIVFVGSANRILQKPNSVDYIFTDPPFGSNLMYSELSFLWESWLKVKTNTTTEAIVNRSQGKGLLEYQELMLRCFQEYYRILKPGRWLTVEFSNTSAAVWNGIQTSLQRVGFVIANVAALDKQQGSFKAVTTPTAVKQDLVISCYKPSNEFDQKFQSESGEVNVWAFVEEHLEHLPVSIIKNKKTTAVIERSPKILYDRLITYYLMQGLPIPIDAAEFQIKLKTKFVERDGMVFLSEQVAQYDDQKRKLGEPEQYSLVFDIIYSESDAVAWLKERLEKKSQKYQDIQPDFRKANAATRKGEKEIELRILMNENFIELSDGRWRAPDPNEAKDREILRIKALLREFGKYLEEIANPKTKKLKDVRVEALRAGFKASWDKRDFSTIVEVCERIPENLLLEDEQLLMFYDIAKDRL